jgi:tetratricopeptide (TPR) repeat protein
MNCFARLGIAETTDIKTIKAAYARLLPAHSPESDPEGFQLLRSAFEEAQSFARGTLQEPARSPLDTFMERFEGCYNDYCRRLDLRSWRELLQDPLCHHIDSASETEGRIMAFLMDSYYFPHDVWQVFNDTFGWTARQQQLSTQFSENFVDFILDKVRIKGSFEFHELLPVSGDAELFLKEHGNACRSLESGDYFQAWNSLRTMEALLPGQTNLMVLKGRYYATLLRYTEAARCYATLLESGVQNLDLFYYAGELLAGQGRLQEAKEHFQKALEMKPDSNGSAYWYGKCCMGLQHYSEGVKCFEQILARLPGHQEIGLLHKSACLFALEQLEVNDNGLTKYYQKAELNYQAGNLDVCRELLRTVPESGTMDSSHHSLMGKVAYASGNPAEAVLAYDEALKLTPGDAEILLAKASALHDIGHYHEAVSLYEAVVRQKSENTAALNNLAHALILLERYEEALHYCNQAIMVDGGFAWAYKNRALVRLKQKQYENCISDAKQAVRLQSHLLEGYMIQLKAFNEVGRYSQVHQVFSEAMDCGVQDAELILQKAHAYRLSGEYDDALDGYQMILDSEPENGEAHLNRGECLYWLERYPDAVEAFDRALECGGVLSQAYWMKAKSLFNQEKYPDLQECISAAVEVDVSEQDRLYNLLGMAHMEEERYDEALTSFRKSVQLNPECFEYHYNIGLCFSNMKRFDESLASLSHAQNFNPVDEDLLVNKSYVLYNLKNYRDVVSVCNSLLKINPSHETAMRNKGWALYKLEERDAAMETVNKGLRLCGEMDHFLNLKITILRDRGMLQDALAVTNRFLELYPDSESAQSHHKELNEMLGKKFSLNSILGKLRTFRGT